MSLRHPIRPNVQQVNVLPIQANAIKRGLIRCPMVTINAAKENGARQGDRGDVVLHQSGNEVSGTYTHEQGTIVGTVSGNKLKVASW